MAERYYAQCKLEKKLNDEEYEDGTERKGAYLIDIAWIPKEFAKVGRVVKIKKDGVWDEDWTVTAAGGPYREEAYILERERDYTRQRKASDI